MEKKLIDLQSIFVFFVSSSLSLHFSHQIEERENPNGKEDRKNSDMIFVICQRPNDCAIIFSLFVNRKLSPKKNMQKSRVSTARRNSLTLVRRGGWVSFSLDSVIGNIFAKLQRKKLMLYSLSFSVMCACSGDVQFHCFV